MAAAVTDKFKKAGASTVTSLAAPGKAIGATSITVGSTTNYPLDTGVVVAIRVVDTAGALVAGTYTEWNAIVTSATSFTLDPTPVYGSDQVYAAGSTTQVYISVSSSAHNQLVDGLLVSHDQDGTLKAGAVDVAAVLANDVVETAKIKDAAVTSAKVATGAAVQIVYTNSSAVATGTTIIPNDSTIPQITEGDEYMTLDITPKSATNRLRIEATALLSSTAGISVMSVALFKDATANALSSVADTITANTAPNTIKLDVVITAGSTSPITFRIRAGAQTPGTTTFNGVDGTVLFGSIPKSSIVITEYKA